MLPPKFVTRLLFVYLSSHSRESRRGEPAINECSADAILGCGVALGADATTFAGLAGLGDLVLTCTGGLSRNRKVGLALGEGRPLQAILAEMGMVAEGVKNTSNALALARKVGVDLPIVEVMDCILREEMTVRDAVSALMLRELKAEGSGSPRS